MKSILCAGIILLSSCANLLKSNTCDEKDVVCRSKNYTEFIKAGEFQKLDEEFLSKGQVKQQLGNLNQAKDFFNQIDENKITYIRNDDTYSAMFGSNIWAVEVGGNDENSSYKNDGKGAVIVFFFGTKPSSDERPCIGFLYAGIPPKK